MRVILALFLILAAFAVRADTFGGWSFDPPDDYELQPSDIGVSYTGPNGGYLFLPQTPATDARSAALAMIAEALPAGTDMQEVPAGATADSSFWAGESEGVQYVFRSVAQGGQSGTIMFITPAGDFSTVTSEIEAMLAADFAPSALVAPTLTSSFPAQDWPAPPTSREARTHARFSVAQALALGIDPEATLLPGTFDCYQTSTPRAVDPRPDLRITVDAMQGYTVSDGARENTGTWYAQADDTFDQVIRFTGWLADAGYVLPGAHDGLGQSFDIDHPEKNAELTCTQDGPATEAQLQAMAAVAPTQGAMACTLANGQTVRLLYGNGTYILDGARGSYVAALEGDYGTWRGQMEFSGGPFDLLDAEVEAADGQQVMTVSQTWTEGSIFYSSSETTISAICRMAAPPRLPPVYGPDPAPATARPQGGLPEGIYRSFEGRWEFYGTGSNYTIAEVITLIAPGGRMLQDPDFAAFGDTPDCSRTTPSGQEVCGEYRKVGPMISFRDERDFGADAWSDNERLTLTDTGFDIGDISYTLMPQASPDNLIGTWTSSAYTGGGPGFGGGVGQYTDSDTRWEFGPDGRFAWQDDRTTTTLITADPILGGVQGGGSNSSSDSGTGRWQLNGMWLELQFDDGRKKRLTAFHTPATADSAASITVDGVDLAPPGSGD